MNTEELVKLLQYSITPVILISAVGLLLLSMTNRYGRVIDRTRALIKEVQHQDKSHSESIIQQINTLYERAGLLRYTIIFTSLSVFFTGLTIILLFATLLTKLSLHVVLISSFALSILSLLASMLFFMQDLSTSLSALRLESKDYLYKKK